MLAIYNKDNAAAIFEVFRQNRPNMNINAFDADDNTGTWDKLQQISSLFYLRNLWAPSVVQ